MKVNGRKETKIYEPELIRNMLEACIGRTVEISVKCRGKSAAFTGEIIRLYDKVFLFEYHINGNAIRTSFSYLDVFTGAVFVLTE